MATDINWDRLEKKVVEEATRAIDSELQNLKAEIDKNTPIDTGVLIDNTKIRPTTVSGGRISWSVYNETPYGKFVEYGVLGKTYNYHKNKRIFYVGVGARMFTRAYDKLRGTIAKRLAKALNI